MKMPGHEIHNTSLARVLIIYTGGTMGMAPSDKTPSDDPCCIAEFTRAWCGEPVTLIQEITHKTKTLMGESEIILSVIPLDGVKIWFKGLYLALFTEASF